MQNKIVFFAYGQRSNGYVTCTVDFELNELEKNLFENDVGALAEKLDEELRRNNHIFEIGRFCGENKYMSFLLALSLEHPGRLIIELPQIAGLNKNHYNDLQEFLRNSLGFEIK